MDYYYPGNVRELKAAIELAAVMCNGNLILPEDITFSMVSNAKRPFFTEEKTLKEYDLEIVQLFLEKYDNNVLKVAEKLDIGKSTIYSFIQENNLNVKQN